MAGRPKAELILSESEKHQLEAYTRRRKTSQALALRNDNIVRGIGYGRRVRNYTEGIEEVNSCSF